MRGGIGSYLSSPTYYGTCQGDLRERIIRLWNEAEYIRGILDTPPDCSLPPEPVLLDRIAAQRDRRVEDRRYVLTSEVDAELSICSPRDQLPAKLPNARCSLQRIRGQVSNWQRDFRHLAELQALQSWRHRAAGAGRPTPRQYRA